MAVVYNEIDPFAAEWLRQLIKHKQIADGVVIEGDMRDIVPRDLLPFKQIHMCAGIGVWSRAAINAGWDSERRLITASLPCQPFSAAGKGGGFDDERHLWPDAFHIFESLREIGWWQNQSIVIVGEQVASLDGLAWLDLVQTDMEGSGHAFGAVDICAAGFGAPHIRQRSYWLAYHQGRRERAGFRNIGSAN